MSLQSHLRGRSFTTLVADKNMNKKAQYFAIFSVIGIVILGSLLFIMAYKHFSVTSGKKIGSNQADMLSAYRKAESALLYVDLSAEAAVPEAFRRVAGNGGYGIVYDEGYAELSSKCGAYDGFILWNKGNAECFPDSDLVRRSFTSVANSILEEKYAAYSDVFIPAGYAFSFKGGDVLGITEQAIRISSPAGISPSVSSSSVWPVDARVTSCYGYREDPITGQKGKWHDGADFGVAEGTGIRAVADGEVYAVENDPSGYGLNVIVKHSDTVYVRYAHLLEAQFKKGGLVRKGEVIAKAGSTGYSTGPHLHLSFYRQGSADSTPVFSNRDDYSSDPFCFLPPESRGIQSPCSPDCTAGEETSIQASSSNTFLYDVKPNFRQAIGFDVAEFEKVTEKAREMLAECRGKQDALSCLKKSEGQSDGLKVSVGCGRPAMDSGYAKFRIDGVLQHRFAMFFG